MPMATIILAAVSVATGIWLTLAGTPYGILLSTVHKLASVAGLAGATVVAWPLIKGRDIDTLLITLAAATIVAALVSVVTGALLLGAKEVSPAVRLTHRVAPWITCALATVMLVVLHRK